MRNTARQLSHFRVPGDIEAVTDLRLELERWQRRRKKSVSSPSNHSPIHSNGDPHVAASLLKLWYRELEEPLIPMTHYKQALQNYSNPDKLLSVSIHTYIYLAVLSRERASGYCRV